MSGSTSPSTPAPLQIPQHVLTEIYAHARETFPAECCGWIAGPRSGTEVTRVRRCANAYDPATHPTANDRSAETAYVIDGEDLLTLSRALDGDEPPRVLYHSHPNGRAYFSETDRRVATDPWGEGPMLPVQQLVVGIDAERVVEAALFAWDDAVRGFVEVSRWTVATI
jgi:proteasome lid subunit RPN8/RPN11